MKSIRLIATGFVGILWVYLTYQSKYRIFFVESIAWGLLTVALPILAIWNLKCDIKRSKNRLSNYLGSAISFIFIVIGGILQLDINADLKKPTLLKVATDHDFNGVTIDFKTDGTYIFESYVMGMSDFVYGKYNVLGDSLTIDKDNIEKVVVSRFFRIVDKKLKDGTSNSKYLYQIERGGNLSEDETYFNITIDNREKRFQ